MSENRVFRVNTNTEAGMPLTCRNCLLNISDSYQMTEVCILLQEPTRFADVKLGSCPFGAGDEVTLSVDDGELDDYYT